MAKPTPTDLKGISYSKDGTPWVRFGKSGQDADGLSWSKDGTPFYFVEDGGTPPASAVVKINVGDSWREYVAMKINVSDEWKSVVGIKINVGDSWRDVF